MDIAKINEEVDSMLNHARLMDAARVAKPNASDAEIIRTVVDSIDSFIAANLGAFENFIAWAGTTREKAGMRVITELANEPGMYLSDMMS